MLLYKKYMLPRTGSTVLCSYIVLYYMYTIFGDNRIEITKLNWFFEFWRKVFGTTPMGSIWTIFKQDLTSYHTYICIKFGVNRLSIG